MSVKASWMGLICANGGADGSPGQTNPKVSREPSGTRTSVPAGKKASLL
jgi:hypothetical protein